jgi:hypothetical protein
MFNALHGRMGHSTLWSSKPSSKKKASGRHTISQKQYVWRVMAVAAVYQFLPSYIAPFLKMVSLLCYLNFFVSNKTVQRYLLAFGSATPQGNFLLIILLFLTQWLILFFLAGAGLFSLTFDWSMIGSYNPITSPLWAILNQFLGFYVFYWLLSPILWSFNAYGFDQVLGFVKALVVLLLFFLKPIK